MSKPGEQPERLVTQIRRKTYFRINHKTGAREMIGEGSEIVREVLISAEHYNKLMAEGFTPEVIKDTKEREEHTSFQAHFTVNNEAHNDRW